ncbi:MAG TPA: protoheme IX farnesyltransferase [Desulfuromonadales bacterium]|nr:protoheme IX farnesyltransferase [Desulfuromonadales bacterium]
MIPVITALSRPRLSLLNGITALAGYLLFPAHISVSALSVALCGVALLAAGGSAINQALEGDLDGRMMRTAARPVPRGALSPAGAAAIGGVMIALGLVSLFTFGGAMPALLGVAALLWYLAVYTPLKRHTSLALPIGALCGAFPPLIGWTLAGGVLHDYRIIMLAGLLVLWQIPHFWLFQRRYADEYRQAGIPLLHIHEGTSLFLWLWLAALYTAAMLLPAFGIIARHFAVWCVLLPFPILFFKFYRSGRQLFACINCFPLLLTLLIAAQRHTSPLQTALLP